MLVVTFLALASVAIPVVYASVNAPLDRAVAERFSAGQNATVTPFNGDRIVRYLQVNMRFRRLGAAAGLAFAVAVFAQEKDPLNVFYAGLGWFLGVVAAGIAFTRSLPATRRPLGLRLVSPYLAACWGTSTTLTCAVAFSAVVRSFLMEVGVAERLWAVLALGIVLTVHLLVRELNTRVLPAGPADLVGAEVAMRSKSARTLLTAGSLLAVWAAYRSGLPPALHGMEITWVGLGLLALLDRTASWRMAARPARRVPWSAAVALVLCGALVVTWQRNPQEAGYSVSFDAGPGPLPAVPGPVRYAYLGGRPEGWSLVAAGEQDTDMELFMPLSSVASRLEPGPFGRAAPLALSGDGHHVAYLEAASRRMVVLDVATPRLHHLTGPLADEAVPEPRLSHDGRYAALLFPDRLELVDTRTGSRASFAAARRVLGVGPDGVVTATSGRRALPGAPDTELLTLHPQGGVPARAPFDPTLEARLSPDGRTLATVTTQEVATMDPRTGVVRGRAPLRLPGAEGSPRIAGWSGDGRLLVRIDPPGSAELGHYLVDVTTGKAQRVRELDNLGSGLDGLTGSLLQRARDLDGAVVFGRIR